MSKSYWKLTDEEYEFIKGEVIHIFEKYNVRCMPVSGFEIASKMEITLVSYSGLSKRKLKKALEVSEDGFFIEKDGKAYIFFNDIDKCYERQNWTILHEIGHIVLDHTGHSYHEEDEANFFAKYAIAPPVLVHRIGAECPQDIYEAFDISFEAATYAYEYYCSWKAHYERRNRLAVYEEKLISLYKKYA